MSVVASEGDLTLRRLEDGAADYALIAAWRNRPHVREWWDPDDPPMTAASAAAEYRDTTLARSATASCVIEWQGRAAGFVQYYPWDSETAYLEDVGLSVPAGAWGLDILIGEPDLVGRGIGTAAVDLLCRHLTGGLGATAVGLVVASDNARARRAYEKAGFRPVTEILDTDTRDGERVRSWLMVRP